MRYYRFIIAMGVIMIALAACGTAVTQTAAVEPTATDPIVEATATTAPTSTPIPTVDECLNCHTDKDQLIAVAAPIEEVDESESSGVG